MLIKMLFIVFFCKNFLTYSPSRTHTLKVPNVEFDFGVMFSTLMHRGKTKRKKYKVEMDKLGHFGSVRLS